MVFPGLPHKCTVRIHPNLYNWSAESKAVVAGSVDQPWHLVSSWPKKPSEPLPRIRKFHYIIAINCKFSSHRSNRATAANAALVFRFENPNPSYKARLNPRKAASQPKNASVVSPEGDISSGLSATKKSRRFWPHRILLRRGCRPSIIAISPTRTDASNGVVLFIPFSNTIVKYDRGRVS